MKYGKVYKKFLRFYSFSLPDKILIVKASLLLVSLRLVLKFVSINKLYPVLHIFCRKNIYSYKDKLDYASRVVWAVDKSGKYLLRIRCLSEALAVHIFLNRKRIINNLQIGFIKNKNGITAHAWIEAGDKILIGESNDLDLYFKLSIRDFSSH